MDTHPPHPPRGEGHLVFCGHVEELLRVLGFVHQLFVAGAVAQRIREKLKKRKRVRWEGVDE